MNDFAVAWLSEDAPQRGNIPVVNAAPPAAFRSARTHSEARDWSEQALLLRKREALAQHDVSQTGEGLRYLKDVWEHEALAAQSREKAQQALWQQWETARQLLGCIQREVGAPSQHPTDTSRLMSHVNKLDALLSSAKRAQHAALQELHKQQQQLEEEVLEAAMSIQEDEEDVDNEASGVGGEAQHRQRRRSGGQAGTSGGGGAAAAARPNSSSRLCVRKEGWTQSAGGACHTSRPAASAYRSRSAERREGSLAPEVEEYEDFVMEHGETGGWEAEDHNEFVSVLKACSGDYAQAVGICCERMIGFRRQDIVQHARWHMDLLDLQVRKRVALARWRATREAERQQLHARAALIPDVPQQAAERDQSSKHEQVAQHARQVEKELVKDWKEQRALSARRRVEAAETAAAAAREEQKRRVMQRQRDNKERLHVHQAVKDQMRREAARRAAVAAAERAAASSVTPQEVVRVRRRTNEHLQRRHSLMVGKEEQARLREHLQQSLLDKVVVAAPRDPNRLFQPTAAAAERARATQEDKHAAKDSAFILHVSHKVVPSWLSNR